MVAPDTSPSLPFWQRFSSRFLLVAIVIGGGGLTSALHSIQRQHETALAATAFLGEAENVVAGLQEALRRSATLPKTAAAVIRTLPRLDAGIWRSFVRDLRPFAGQDGAGSVGLRPGTRRLEFNPAMCGIVRATR